MWLTCPTPARAQTDFQREWQTSQPAPMSELRNPETNRFLVQRVSQNMPFPYAQGVAMDLTLYAAVCLQMQRADSVIASKNRRLGLLQARVDTAAYQYQICRDRLTVATNVAIRKTLALGQVSSLATEQGKLASRPRFDLLEPRTWLYGAAFLAVGVVIGTQLK